MGGLIATPIAAVLAVLLYIVLAYFVDVIRNLFK